MIMDLPPKLVIPETPSLIRAYEMPQPSLGMGLMAGTRVAFATRAITITVTDTGSVAASSGVASFGSKSISTAAPDRYVVVAVSAEANADITGVDINGAAAALAVFGGRNTGASPDVGSAIYWQLVPGGTTASIDVHIASGNVGITVFNLTGGTGAVFSTDTDPNTSGGADDSMILNADKDSGTIFCCGNNGTGGITFSGSTVTAGSNFNVGADRHATAYRVDATATSLSVQNSGGVNRSFCAASFT